MHWYFRDISDDPSEKELTQQDQFNNDEVALAEAIVRETVQNSTDAQAVSNSTVRVRFAIHTISGSDRAVFEEIVAGLSPHLRACGIPVPSPSEPLRALVVEDFGTTGLTGSVKIKDNGQFSGFWRRICFRVRMTAALKRMHLQETVVLEDDTDTMMRLVGKRVIPILVKDDGQPMLESMDMVAYLDGLGEPILTGPQRSEISAWTDEVITKTVPLTMPRYPLLGLPEFGTIAALDHYIVRKRKRLGDFVELRAKTREQIDALMPELEALEQLIESPTAVNGKLSLDDIRVLPLLRSAAVVKGLRFPQKVRDYFELMMSRIGYQPLPAV